MTDAGRLAGKVTIITGASNRNRTRDGEPVRPAGRARVARRPARGEPQAAEQGITFEAWKSKALEAVPLRAISRPQDIANLALFLAGDESRTITGQSINCDAGGYMVG